MAKRIHYNNDPRGAALRFATALGLLLGAVLVRGAEAQAPAIDAEAMTQLFRALQPRVTIEIAETNLNAYLQAHPRELGIPPDFADPRVSFRNGLVEFSARKQVLFIASRVSVGLAPQIVRGRLRLVVRRVRASGIPLPTCFHRGIADTITGPINQALDRNDLQLLGVEVVPGAVRVHAQVEATGATP
ncbi:MAG: hypothetical protein HPY69_09215 [Armatimonadetes bacterium]|nr:hypothetical protein [Armatimonadota bacterium]